MLIAYDPIPHSRHDGLTFKPIMPSPPRFSWLLFTMRSVGWRLAHVIVRQFHPAGRMTLCFGTMCEQ